MKKEFALTTNAKRFEAAMNALIASPPGIDRMALAYGDPGLGKSEAALRFVNVHGAGAAFIRTKKLMSGRWLLEELVAELGEAPAYRTADLFRQAVDILIGSDRLVIFDEADYLTHDAKIIETLRDLHDVTGAPMCLVGMDQADKKLKRYRHLWRRFSQIVKFEGLTVKDVAAVLGQICEAPVSEDLPGHLIKQNSTTTVAMLYRWAQAIERIAKANNLQIVGPADLARG